MDSSSNLVRYRYGTRIIRRRPSRAIVTEHISKEKIEGIYKYLSNPTKNGIWYLTLNYSKPDGITQYIQNEMYATQPKKISNKITTKNLLTKNIFDSGDIKKVFWDIESILAIFKFICKGNLDERDRYGLNEDNFLANLYLKIFNKKKFIRSNKEALDYFKDNLYFDKFTCYISRSGATYLKNSYIVYIEVTDDFDSDKSDQQKLIFVSTDKSSLEKFATFLKLIGKIKSSKLLPIFSPDEKVIFPYFHLLKTVYVDFIDDENVKGLISNSINNYLEGENKYSISNTGIVVEEYLTQIYETLYRKTCDKKASLGDIFDAIHQESQKYISTTEPIVPGVDEIYKKITVLISSKKKVKELSLDSLKIIREGVNYSQKSNIYTLYLLDKITKEANNKPVFPKYLNDNITEIIRYRNSVSHKTRIPIGNYEAIRSMYCCISLIMWWTQMTNMINWDHSKEDIVKFIIETSKTYEN